MSKPKFYIRETAVAINLGVHRDRIREARNQWLKEGEHWEQDGKPIKYSDAGYELLREKLALPRPDDSEGSDMPEIKNAAPGKDGEASEASETAPVTLKVFRTFPNNKRMLEAIKPEIEWTKAERKDRMRVRVKDNTKFVRNMEIACRHLHDDFYECVRQPRFKGKF